VDKKEKTIETLSRIAPELCQKYNLDFLAVFGSVAKGKSRKNSDIDICFKGEINFDNELQLSLELSSLLGTNFIDLVNLKRPSPLLTYLACKEAVLLYEKEKGLFANFRIYAFKHFVETKPLRELNFKRTLGYIKQLNYSS